MRATVFASLAFFGIATAQDLGQLPTCATTCLTKFTGGGEIGGCPQLDAKCICASASFIDSIACCLAEACGPEDQKTAIKFASTFCGTQGVQVPNAVVCKSSSALPSATLAPSGTASASGTAQASTTAAGSTPTASTENKPSVAPTANPQNAGPQNAVAPGFAGLLGSLAAAFLLNYSRRRYLGQVVGLVLSISPHKGPHIGIYQRSI